jgi:hypothetical protein
MSGRTPKFDVSVGARNGDAEIIRHLDGARAEIKCHACGGTKVIKRSNLRSTRSCGCKRYVRTWSKPPKTPVGTKHDYIELIEYVERKFVKIKCHCGKIVTIRAANFASARSCGCMRSALQAASKRTHGEAVVTAKTPEYTTWLGIHARCANPTGKNASYVGITVCDRWSSFELFLADMGRRPPKHSIERRNSKLGYSPDNCFWATATEQARNRPDWCWSVTWKGETHPLHEWSTITGLSVTVIRNRLWRGWSEERALTQPFRPPPTKSKVVDS